jgi:hypothetical protein
MRKTQVSPRHEGGQRPNVSALKEALYSRQHASLVAIQRLKAPALDALEDINLLRSTLNHTLILIQQCDDEDSRIKLCTALFAGKEHLLAAIRTHTLLVEVYQQRISSVWDPVELLSALSLIPGTSLLSGAGMAVASQSQTILDRVPCALSLRIRRQLQITDPKFSRLFHGDFSRHPENPHCSSLFSLFTSRNRRTRIDPTLPVHPCLRERSLRSNLLSPDRAVDLPYVCSYNTIDGTRRQPVRGLLSTRPRSSDRLL